MLLTCQGGWTNRSRRPRLGKTNGSLTRVRSIAKGCRSLGDCTLNAQLAVSW